MPEVPLRIDWITGFVWTRWTLGYGAVLFGSLLGSDYLAIALGVRSKLPLSVATILYAVIGTAIVIPAVLGYCFLTPSPANLGVLGDGLIVEIGSPTASRFAFRQGYRWSELRLSGRTLVLSRKNSTAPRSLRLTAFQAARLTSLVTQN